MKCFVICKVIKFYVSAKFLYDILCVKVIKSKKIDAVGFCEVCILLFYRFMIFMLTVGGAYL